MGAQFRSQRNDDMHLLLLRLASAHAAGRVGAYMERTYLGNDAARAELLLSKKRARDRHTSGCSCCAAASANLNS